MEETQLFRLIGSAVTVEIPVSHVGGQNIVFWEDVEQVFPGMQHVQNGKVAVNVLRDSDGNSITPHRIKHLPGVVLDVIKSTGPSTEESKFREYVVEKVDKLDDNVIKVLHNQRLMQDRLALIQQKAEAILVQNYELLEYTIPRLFIVLPETSMPWDPAKMFRTKFRLYFIYECGEHTKVPGSTFPNHLHLAKHEGYTVNKPTKFFEKYGPFLMAMLHLIKVGAGIAGHLVPTLANLKVVDVIDSTLSAVDSVTKQVIDDVDYSIKYLEENRTQIQKSNGVDTEGGEVALRYLESYFSRVEGLEGVDLRQLGSYLKANSPDNLLGNLYCITTDKGHVKWVCIDHYRQAYNERDQQDFEKAVQVNDGSYDPQLGKVVISLGSKIIAEEFFYALTKARRVDDLDITFNWVCSRSDLEKLENALKESRVSILRLDIRKFRTSFGRKLIAASTQYETLFHIVELPNTKRVHVVLPNELAKLSDFKPKRPSDLHKLSYAQGRLDSDSLALRNSLIGDNGAQALSEALKVNSTLTTLSLYNNSVRDNGAQALSEALKTNSTLTTLDLTFNSIGSDGAQALSEALKTNSTLTTLDLTNNSIGSDGAQALSEALKTNSTLTTLDLYDNSIGSSGTQALFEALKTNSTLTTLNLYGNSIRGNTVQRLLKALRTNLTLAILDLTYNSIESNGAQALFEAPKTNSTLTTLIWWNNTIRDDGVQTLSEALKINSTLTTLDLSFNSIGFNGARALSEALKTNSTLTTLNLRDNSIGDSGAQALSETLKTNSTLTTLDLYNNSIGSNGAQALSEALKANSTCRINGT
ncbi:hypothetical protein BGZ79_010970 [Entomortierella chlamydospora]|nr:hypothetical protein BGZ79_010970 [Entomortierella chlamydospora]